jgi:hypothetical protein
MSLCFIPIHLQKGVIMEGITKIKELPFVLSNLEPICLPSRLVKKVNNKQVEINGKTYYGVIEEKCAWAYFLTKKEKETISSKVLPEEMDSLHLLLNPVIMVPTSIVNKEKERLDSWLVNGLDNSSIIVGEETIIFIFPDDEEMGPGIVNQLFPLLDKKGQQEFFLSYLEGDGFYSPEHHTLFDKHVYARSLIVRNGEDNLYEVEDRHPHLFNNLQRGFPPSMFGKAFGKDIKKDDKFYQEANSFFVDLFATSYLSSVTFFIFCYLLGKGVNVRAFTSPRAKYSKEVKKMAKVVWDFEFKQ